jgi:hypothetical protein
MVKYLGILIAFLQVVLGYECQFNIGHTHINLSPLTRSTGDTFSMNKDGFYYEVQICEDLFSTCHGETGVAMQWDKAGECISVLGRQNPKYGGLKMPVVEYIDNTTPLAGVVLTYFNGDICIDQGYKERQTDILIHCGESNEGKLVDVYEKEPCHYVFEINSAAGCVISEVIKNKKAEAASKSAKILIWSLIGFLALMSFLILKATETKQENTLRRFVISPLLSIWRMIGAICIFFCGCVTKVRNSMRGGGKYSDIL